MGFRLGDTLSNARELMPCYPKVSHADRDSAVAHLQSQAAMDTTGDVERLNVFRCRDCGCWHVGHGKNNKLEKSMTQLKNLFVRNISAVRNPANRRKFLLMKSADVRLNADDHVEYFDQHEQCWVELTDADARRAGLLSTEGEPHMPTLTKADIGAFIEKLELIMKATPEQLTRRPSPSDRSATSEVEYRVGVYLSANPAATRGEAINAVFSADRALYDRYRGETVIDKHGRTLAETYGRATASYGVDQQGREVKKYEVNAEIFRRASQVVAKGEATTMESAIGAVFSSDPDLYQQYRASRLA
jgi:hypothetical protein